MRIVIDLDGTLCPIRDSDISYENLEPLPGAIDFVKTLKLDGHYIIIQTARNMATQNGNLGKVIQNIGKTTLDWLAKFGFEYDEIYFGKPNGDIYIDDRAFRFESWESTTINEIKSLAKKK